MNEIYNHVGYGLRQDEKPYAHKIPPGKNWRALPVHEQKAFMKGSFNNGGGNSYQLRRMDWGEQAATLTTAVMGKATCQLHPGYDFPGRGMYQPYDLPVSGTSKMSCVELFAGAGLMGVGLKAAGLNLIWANDFNKEACRAYSLNLGDHIIQGDIANIDLNIIPEADVYAGGPPCQDFSVAGKGAGESGDKGILVWSYLNIIDSKKPKAFLFENVKGLVSRNHVMTFNNLLRSFSDIGYDVFWNVVNALDHGVAQKRERVFIIGFRKDLHITFNFPGTVSKLANIRDAIGDLPDPPEPPHPRRFTVREYLRLQSVPDWYRFPEDMSLQTQYRLVGNGVASKVAYDLARTLISHLEEKL